VVLPFTRRHELVKEFKQSPRREDDIAIVNAGARGMGATRDVEYVRVVLWCVCVCGGVCVCVCVCCVRGVGVGIGIGKRARGWAGGIGAGDSDSADDRAAPHTVPIYVHVRCGHRHARAAGAWR
jgi:hypothetical protein